MHPGYLEVEIAKLSPKLARNPTSRIFAPLAEAYRQAGRLSEAIEICRRGLVHHPDYLSGQIVLARCHYDRGELEPAVELFQSIVAADPRSVAAVRALGEISRARGDLEGALSRYGQAHELDSGDAELRERLDELRAERERVAVAPPSQLEQNGREPDLAEAEDVRRFREWLRSLR
jgi:tetratricopeptide (TPR) repeat protein